MKEGWFTVNPSRAVELELGQGFKVNLLVEYTPVNYCKTNNGGCGVNSNCIFVRDREVRCECKAGYSSPNGKNCAAVNPCLTDNGGCRGGDSLERCVYDGPGQHTCVCKEGYFAFSGLFCEASNGCLTDNGGCGSSSTW